MWTLVSGVIALVATALATRSLGHALKARPVLWYRGSMAGAVVAAMGILFASAMVADPVTKDVLWGIGLGLGFGGLAGLRYGYKGLFEVTAGKGRS